MLSLGWGYHSQAIDLWLQSIPERMNYANVWVLEDDVGYTGNMSDLVQAYLNDPSDLISDKEKAYPPSPIWPWRNEVTGAYSRKVTPPQRLMTREHVQRLS